MNENTVLLVHLDGTAINPRSVDAVWSYTAGNVFVCVRAGGMTFKQTYLVDYEAFPGDAARAQTIPEALASELVNGIKGIMMQVANPDAP